MPIGVPKVPYSYMGDNNGVMWIDVYNFLFRSRMIMFGSDLDEELTNQMIGIMLYLNTASSSDQGRTGGMARGSEMYMYINSLGGSLPCGVAVYDVVNYVRSGVYTVGLGLAASMASFVLMGGEKRVLLPHARLLLHQPQGGLRGQSSDLIATARELGRWRSLVVSLYAKRTGQDPNVITDHMNRDIFLGGEDAIQFGLVDKIASVPQRKDK